MSRQVARIRYKGIDWTLNESDGGNGVSSADEAILAVLMDLRDEMRALNATMSCYRFREMADTIIAMGKPRRRPSVKEAARIMAKRRMRMAKP